MEYRLFPHQRALLEKLKDARHAIVFPSISKIGRINSLRDQALKKEPEQLK